MRIHHGAIRQRWASQVGGGGGVRGVGGAAGRVEGPPPILRISPQSVSPLTSLYKIKTSHSEEPTPPPAPSALHAGAIGWSNRGSPLIPGKLNIKTSYNTFVFYTDLNSTTSKWRSEGCVFIFGEVIYQAM